MVRPALSTTATDILKPMLSHWARAPWAMTCAIASGIFFCVTRPSAAAVEAKADVKARPVTILKIRDMDYASLSDNEARKNIPMGGRLFGEIGRASCRERVWM